MPTLKQLTCNVEWEGSSTALEEYQTAYSDGYVETYIAVPETPVTFSIHLQSNGYIASGLSMFVFMDGVYQCNRNRQNLKIPDEKSTKRQTEVDFRVRQREQIFEDGTYSGRSWEFNRVNIISGPDFGAHGRPPYDGQYLGTIEVVVLRCCLPRKFSLKSAVKFTNQNLCPIDEAEDAAAAALKSSEDNVESADTKPKQKSKIQSNAQSNSQHKSKAKAKVKRKRQPFGLDGYWDDFTSSKPASSEENKAKHDQWHKLDAPTCLSENASHQPQQDVVQSSPKNASQTGAAKIESVGEGIYNPVTAAKKSGFSAEPIKGSVKDALHIGSQNTAQQDAPYPSTKNGQQNPASVHLRGGGGSEAQYITSGGSTGRQSPLVVNNSIVYNGVNSPTPLSAGPPPRKARQFWTNMEAQQKGKHTPKVTAKPNAEIDPWDEFPEYDAGAADTGPSAAKKVDNWETNRHGMPGAWDTPNDAYNNQENGWHNTTEATVGDQNPNDNYNSYNGDQNSRRNQPNGKVHQDANNWNNAGDQADRDDCNQNWGGNGPDGNQRPNDWNNDNTNDGTQTNGWNEDPTATNENNESWIINGTEGSTAKGKGKKGRKKGNKGQNRKANQAKEAQNESAASKTNLSEGRPVPNDAKPTDSTSNWFNNTSKETGEVPNSSPANKKPPTPGTWHKSSPRSKKAFSPQVPQPNLNGIEAPGEIQPVQKFCMTTPPVAKAYWSKWRDLDALQETVVDDDPDVLREAPHYSVPGALVERTKISHQVHPSLPVHYRHKSSTPKYMDSHEHPYAVFVFHYRDKDAIEQMLNISIPEAEIDEKEMLRGLPKEQLVEEVIKARSQASSDNTSGSRHSSGKATFKSNPQGIPLGPNVNVLTEKLNKLESSKAATPEKVGGWLNSADEPGNGNHSNRNNWNGNGSRNTGDDGDNGQAWNNGNDNQGGENSNNAWDNFNGTTAADDGWDSNNYNAAGGNADSSHNNNNATSWNNDANNDQNGNDWGTNGFSGINTSWNDNSEKDEGNSNAGTSGGLWNW